MAEKDYGLTTLSALPDHGEEGERHEVQTEGDRTSFDRYINFSAIINFGFTLQAGWEGTGLVLGLAFLNGGPASLVYGTLFVTTGSICIALSLGEMASMDPNVGAQYRWSARFAKWYPEFFGLLQGWVTVFAWITCIASTTVPLTTTAKGLLLFHVESYEYKTWHATLFMWTFIFVAIFCNLFLRRIINTLETIGGICHVLFFVIVITVLTMLSERSSPEFVFKTLTKDISGWKDPFVCWSIGLLVPIVPLTAFDGVLHMIDETKEPRKRVPKSMVTSTTMNAVLLFGFIIAVLFCIGDFDKVVASPLPILEVYYQATKSKTVSTILVMMHAVIIGISLFNILASVSRLTWAFARDKGLPFHETLSWIHPTLQIPLPALTLVAVCTCLLALINIGSEVAFNALISIPTCALMLSYFIPICLLTIRKVLGEHPKYGPFKLGRWGLPINIYAMCFCIFCLIWAPFPPMYPVDSTTMNYAGPILIGIVLLALGDWFTTGKKRFQVPLSNYNIEMEGFADNKRVSSE